MMKAQFAPIKACILVAGFIFALSGDVRAQLSFTTNNGTITITGFASPTITALTIPSKTNGYPVTSIGIWAFEGNSEVSSISIPDSVTNIELGALAQCQNMTAITVNSGNPAYKNVNGVLFNKKTTKLIQYPAGKNGSYAIPNGVTNIGSAAFFFCSGLTSVTIPNSVTIIEGQAFYDCFSLTSIAIPSSVTLIGGEGFAGCPLLTSVTLGTNLISIGANAFENCGSLTSVTIPNSVRNVGIFAFGYCGLTSMTIPNSLTNIGSGAFAQCPNLPAINVESNNPTYSSMNGVLFDRSQSVLIEYPAGKSGSYAIPSGVNMIGEDSFWGATSLTGVTVPKSATNIEDFSFSGCSSLIGIYFRGNAPTPSNHSSVFSGDYSGIIYYLPDTAGWGSTFDGLPTVLWNPQAQTSGSNFGVEANRFGFNITGSSNLVIVIEACTNLAYQAWQPLQTNTLNGDSFYFSDPEWKKYPSRYYRLSSQ
jgi:BspA type Leucine rich repeat region (6 copies)